MGGTGPLAPPPCAPLVAGTNMKMMLQCLKWTMDIRTDFRTSRNSYMLTNWMYRSSDLKR